MKIGKKLLFYFPLQSRFKFARHNAETLRSIGSHDKKKVLYNKFGSRVRRIRDAVSYIGPIFEQKRAFFQK